MPATALREQKKWQVMQQQHICPTAPLSKREMQTRSQRCKLFPFMGTYFPALPFFFWRRSIRYSWSGTSLSSAAAARRSSLSASLSPFLTLAFSSASSRLSNSSSSSFLLPPPLGRGFFGHTVMVFCVAVFLHLGSRTNGHSGDIPANIINVRVRQP